MASTAKASVTSWWILAMMSLFFWYRNENHDRVLAVFVFLLAFIELLHYARYSGADPQQGARALFITCWLQCCAVAIAVFACMTKEDNYNKNEKLAYTLAAWNVFLFSFIFIIALGLAYTSKWNFTANLDEHGAIEWKSDTGTLLGNWIYLYIIGLAIPLLLLFVYQSYNDVTVLIMLLYGLFVLLYLYVGGQPVNYSNDISYLAIGFAFIAWCCAISNNKIIINS